MAEPRSLRRNVPDPEAGPPARSFVQQRARDTHQRLLEAAAKLFAERGYDDTQTPDIAERAGVAVGTFYRYFTDKRQAFLELSAQHLEQSYQSVVSRLTPDAFASTRTRRERRATIDQVIDILFESTAENPQLTREFLAVAMRDAELAHLRDEYEERGRQAIAALIRANVPAGRIPDADAAARVISVAAQDVALVTAGLRGPVPSPREAQAIRAALADMFYRYAFGDD